MDSRFADIRATRRIRRDFGANAFELPSAYVFQCLPLRNFRRRFVQVNRNLIAVPDLFANIIGHGDTIIDCYPFNGDERNYVSGSHARMRSDMIIQIDQL